MHNLPDPPPEAHSTGWDAYDKAVGGLAHGSITTIMMPGLSGITTLGLQLAKNLIKQNKIVGYITTESTERDILRRIDWSSPNLHIYDNPNDLLSQMYGSNQSDFGIINCDTHGKLKSENIACPLCVEEGLVKDPMDCHVYIWDDLAAIAYSTITTESVRRVGAIAHILTKLMPQVKQLAQLDDSAHVMLCREKLGGTQRTSISTAVGFTADVALGIQLVNVKARTRGDYIVITHKHRRAIPTDFILKYDFDKMTVEG